MGPFMWRIGSYIPAMKEYRSLSGIIETSHQEGSCRLSSSRWTYKCIGLPFLHGEVHILKDILPIWVVE